MSLAERVTVSAAALEQHGGYLMCGRAARLSTTVVHEMGDVELIPVAESYAPLCHGAVGQSQ